MAESPTTSVPQMYPVGNARHNLVVGFGNLQGFRLAAGMADKPAERPSLKGKLEAFKAKAAGGEGKPTLEKAKKKEEIL